MRLEAKTRRRFRSALIAAGTACVSVALLVPANAQFWNPFGSRPRPQPQQQYNPFGGFFGPSPDSRPQAPVDYSRAPAPPRRAEAPAPTATIVVMGDAMADWLAYGLEDAFSEKPEIGILRKHRTTSGLIRYEPRRETEWAQVAREIIAAEKPQFIVMMIGVHDRQAIRERAPAPRQPGARPNTPQAPQAPDETPAPPQQDFEQQPVDPPDNPEQPTLAAPEQGRGAAGTAQLEFHTERWEAAYIRRIDATIGVLKSAGVPVFWVGLPPLRNTRASSDSAYLNELYRSRAEKLGITYVDVWDGFVDEAGRYVQQGPDVDGQIRRLRTGDGVYFTKFGARKLAHYLEREIQRAIANRAIPVALPSPESAPQGPGARPGGPAARPVVGPVVPLTASTTGSNELLGGGVTRPSGADPVATRVLTKGEPIPAPTGRADDFTWPRTSAIPVEPAPPTPATAVAPATTTQPKAAQAPQGAGATAQGTDPAGQARKRPPRPPNGTAGPNAAPRPPMSINPRSWFW